MGGVWNVERIWNMRAPCVGLACVYVCVFEWCGARITYSLAKYMVPGKVRKFYSSCDGEVREVESCNDKKYPILLKAAKQFLREAPRINYKFEALTNNENQHAATHVGKITKAIVTLLVLRTTLGANSLS